MRHTDALRRAFILFHITLSAVIFLQSLLTVLHTAGSPKLQHNGIALIILAGAEAVAALLFLLPFTMRLAGASLLLIFAVAIVIHTIRGEFPSALLVYAAGGVFVMAHGSAFGKGELARHAARV
jgi:uncharacterized membrane protein YphA (DoxX/SURF4 family)